MRVGAPGCQTQNWRAAGVSFFAKHAKPRNTCRQVAIPLASAPVLPTESQSDQVIMKTNSNKDVPRAVHPIRRRRAPIATAARPVRPRKRDPEPLFSAAIEHPPLADKTATVSPLRCSEASTAKVGVRMIAATGPSEAASPKPVAAPRSVAVSIPGVARMQIGPNGWVSVDSVVASAAIQRLVTSLRDAGWRVTVRTRGEMDGRSSDSNANHSDSHQRTEGDRHAGRQTAR